MFKQNTSKDTLLFFVKFTFCWITNPDTDTDKLLSDLSSRYCCYDEWNQGIKCIATHKAQGINAWFQRITNAENTKYFVSMWCTEQVCNVKYLFVKKYFIVILAQTTVVPLITTTFLRLEWNFTCIGYFIWPFLT